MTVKGVSLENNYSYKSSHVIYFLTIFRVLQLTIVYFTPFQFDTSSSILIERYATKVKDANVINYPEFLVSILNNLMSWDSVYFLKLSMEGITFEHEWVFGPLWWRMVYWPKTYFSVPLGLYEVLLIFIILNTTLIVITSKILYILTIVVFRYHEKHLPRNFNITKCAYYSSFILILQPSGIFSIVSYSETMVQFLCYGGLYLYFISRSKVFIRSKLLYFLSGSLFSVGFGIRSNCLLYGVMYLYDLTYFTKFQDAGCILLTGAQLFLALLYSNYVPYQLYCPDRGEWCNSYTKSLVSYAQAYYWNNGFLNYFTLGNIPLFIIAAPQVIIICLSIYKFRSWDGIKPLLLTSLIYIFVQVTVMHVQIVNRVSTFIPLHLWYVSYLLALPNNKIGKNITRWWIIWALIQTALFAAFLPPA